MFLFILSQFAHTFLPGRIENLLIMAPGKRTSKQEVDYLLIYESAIFIFIPKKPS